jgi:hypothetical protein
VRFFSSFGVHPLSRHDISTEERYRIVQRDSNPVAQSDTMITLPFPDLHDVFRALHVSFTDPTLVHELYWSTNGSRDKFSMIVFPGEFKKNDAATNKNQLIMVFTTAQSQRKALSLKNSVIMHLLSWTRSDLFFVLGC